MLVIENSEAVSAIHMDIAVIAVLRGTTKSRASVGSELSIGRFASQGSKDGLYRRGCHTNG